jgi:hypothetical protein
MQPSQALVAAFVHCCFLVRVDSCMSESVLSFALSVVESDMGSSELEVSTCSFRSWTWLGPQELRLASRYMARWPFPGIGNKPLTCRNHSLT